MKYNHTPFLRNIVLCSIFIISNFVIISTVTAGSAAPNLTFRMGMNRVCDSSNHCLNVQATDANTNGEVSILQSFLTKNGYIPKDVRTNGNFGYYTEKGLKLYQADNGITKSGETGPNTRATIVVDMGDGGPAKPTVSAPVYTETVNNVRVYDAGMQTAKTPAFGDNKVFSSDKLGDFAKQKLDEQAKREAPQSSPATRQIDTNTGEAEAKRNAAYIAAQQTASEQPSSWGREDRSNSAVTTQNNGNSNNHVLPKWVRDILGIEGQDPATVPVEDRKSIEPATPNYGKDPVRDVPEQKDPLEEVNKRANLDSPNPNYGNEGTHTDQGSVMNTPEPGHPADINYGNEARNAGTDNYSHEGNNTDQGSVMNTPEPSHPGDSFMYSPEPGWSRDGGGAGGTCFIAGTKILMGDLTLKNIEEVVPGDYVMTPEGSSLVTARMKIPHNGDIYAYNNSGKYFFTPNHPFMTKQGWKSFDPSQSMKETPVITVSTTTIGDILLKYKTQEKVLSYQKKHMNGFVYNFTVAGSHTYYADGYLVHNLKDAGTGDGGGGDSWWSFW